MDNIIFSSNSIIYEGESYPVIYIEEKEAIYSNGVVKYVGGILIMANSEKGLPHILTEDYNYVSKVFDNKSRNGYKSNFAYINSSEKIFSIVESCYKAQNFYETKKRELIINVSPFNYIQY